MQHIRETDKEEAEKWGNADTFIPQKEENAVNIYREITELAKKKKNNTITEDEMAAKAETIWKSYEMDKLSKANSNAIGMREDYYKNIEKISPINAKGEVNPDLAGKFKDFKYAVDGIVDNNPSEEFKAKAQEMESEYKKCIEDKKYAENNSRDIQEKFKNFSRLMLDNAIIAVHNIIDKLKKEDLRDRFKYDEELKTKNFLNVMGDVIDRYLGRTFWKLGIIGNIKAQIAMWNREDLFGNEAGQA